MKKKGSNHIVFLLGTAALSIWLIVSVTFQKQKRNPLAHAILELGMEPQSQDLATLLSHSVRFKPQPIIQWTQSRMSSDAEPTVNPFYSEALDLTLNPPPPPSEPPPEDREEQPEPEPAPPPPPRKVGLFFHGVFVQGSSEVVAWITMDQEKDLRLRQGEDVSDIPYRIQELKRTSIRLEPLREDLDPVKLNINQTVNIEIPIEAP